MQSEQKRFMQLLLEQVKPSLKWVEVSQTPAAAERRLRKTGPDVEPEAFLETFQQVAKAYH